MADPDRPAGPGSRKIVTCSHDADHPRRRPHQPRHLRAGAFPTTSSTSCRPGSPDLLPPRGARRCRVLVHHPGSTTSTRSASSGRCSPASGASPSTRRRARSQLAQQRMMMLMMDPPRHTRLRLIVNKGFTPRMITRLHERVREVARDIVDNIARRGECDFVVDVAAELPLQVIAELMGVPHADRHQLFDWSNQMIGSEDPEYAVSPEDRPDRDDRDVRLRERARHLQASQPVRRHHQRPPAGRGRRRAAQRPRVRPLLRAARRCRQRDHPQPHLARDARAHRKPRPARPARSTTRAPRLHASRRCCGTRRR